jgi:hypothetical protein
MASDSDTKLATQQSIKAYVGTTVNTSKADLAFWQIKRSKFEYIGGATPYALKVGAGFYHVKDKVAKWVSQLTTNAIGSPAASTRYYLYLDYSAITSWTNITATELIWSTTAPAYNQTYAAWMNGDDVCIFGVRTNSGPSAISIFWHDGGNYVELDDYIVVDPSDTTPSNTWTNVDLSGVMPAFATRANVTVVGHWVDTDSNLYCQMVSGTATYGRLVGRVESSKGEWAISSFDVFVGPAPSSQIYNVKFGDATTGNTVTTHLKGWYFPNGM